MRDMLVFAGREFDYGGRRYAIVNYSPARLDYYARCLDRYYTADLFDSDFIEGVVSCPLEVALLLGR